MAFKWTDREGALIAINQLMKRGMLLETAISHVLRDQQYSKGNGAEMTERQWYCIKRDALEYHRLTTQ